jgi:hypothetical protein
MEALLREKSLAGDLHRLFAKSSDGNLSRFGVGFPVEVAAFSSWRGRPVRDEVVEAPHPNAYELGNLDSIITEGTGTDLFAQLFRLMASANGTEYEAGLKASFPHHYAAYIAWRG